MRVTSHGGGPRQSRCHRNWRLSAHRARRASTVPGSWAAWPSSGCRRTVTGGTADGHGPSRWPGRAALSVESVQPTVQVTVTSSHAGGPVTPPSRRAASASVQDTVPLGRRARASPPAAAANFGVNHSEARARRTVNGQSRGTPAVRVTGTVTVTAVTPRPTVSPSGDCQGQGRQADSPRQRAQASESPTSPYLGSWAMLHSAAPTGDI